RPKSCASVEILTGTSRRCFSITASSGGPTREISLLIFSSRLILIQLRILVLLLSPAVCQLIPREPAICKVCCYRASNLGLQDLPSISSNQFHLHFRSSCTAGSFLN